MRRTLGLVTVCVALVAPAVHAEELGSVVARVRFVGAVPPRAAIHAHHNPEVCGAAQPLLEESLVVAPDGGLAGVVAILEGVAQPAPAGEPAAAPAAATLEQKNCTFVPHVQTALTGTTLELGNGDAVLHNVHAFLDGQTFFNLALPRRGVRVKRVLGSPGVISIRCDSGHTWMSAFIVVVPHPYHAVSAASGELRIAGVPPGQYTLKLWHERLGSQELAVTVSAGQESALEATYQPPATGAEAGDATATSATDRIGELEESLRGEVGKAVSALELGLKQERRDRIAQAGRPLFMRFCATCHGASGNGVGPSARFLAVPPRDFTKGEYEFRMTPSGTRARVEDLYRTISLGVPGTAMPAWRKKLSLDQRLLLAEYLMTLAPRFAKGPSGEPIEIPEETPNDAASVARGKLLFEQMQCFQCHGKGGRGNGPAASTTKDDWGHLLRPADLSRGWFQGGTGPKVIFRAFSTGLSGTPMPSYADMMEPPQRWDLVHYVMSLARKRTVIDYLFRDAAGRLNER